VRAGQQPSLLDLGLLGEGTATELACRQWNAPSLTGLSVMLCQQPVDCFAASGVRWRPQLRAAAAATGVGEGLWQPC
jgi:hypothetical protein